MDALIEFGKGPLFRLSFVIMVLGLLRIFILSIIGMVESYRANQDRRVDWKDLTKRTVGWLVPVLKIWGERPVYSVVSFSFHVGLILVPLFLAAHVFLWEGSVGFGWFTLDQRLADLLTLITIVAGLGLFLMRVFHSGARSLSRFQDMIWVPLLLIPFITGGINANFKVSPATYEFMMLLHVYSGNLIMIMIPFTKVAHCVLMPLSQYVAGIGWKFPCGAGDRVMESLGYKDKPTWVEKPRLNGKTTEPAPAVKEVKS